MNRNRHGRNRKRRPARRKPFLKRKPLLLVVCEGEKSEPNYFTGLLRSCLNPRVRIEISDNHGVPLSLVEDARDHKKEAERRARSEKDSNLKYDSVWCVFDIDDHPNVPQAINFARDNQIDLAISNPCFELWLLLHFRTDPGPKHRNQIYDLLKTFLPDYSKDLDFSSFSDGVPKAVERARLLNEAAEEVNELYRNPSTGVYKLTELIRGNESP